MVKLSQQDSLGAVGPGPLAAFQLGIAMHSVLHLLKALLLESIEAQ